MVLQLSNSFYSYYLKFLIVGETSVGKTSLLMSYVGEEAKETLGATIGVDFKHKVVNIDGTTLKIQIWDTAGQERFRTLTKSYFKMAHGIILVFDINNEDSFELLRSWILEINDNCLENTVKILIGNKSDLPRKVEANTANALAVKHKMKYFETSARNKLNVNEVFNNLCRDVISKSDLLDSEFVGGKRDRSLTIKSNNTENYKKKCCL